MSGGQTTAGTPLASVGEGRGTSGMPAGEEGLECHTSQLRDGSDCQNTCVPKCQFLKLEEGVKAGTIGAQGDPWIP